ncbi:hypothetical protein HPSA20_0317 [Helicobacter pylori SouthAfrica20]|uniref:Cell division protein FstH n=1 Tax=Helicobacter pylori SouthAfrica20 TaxID=1352356 RepID=T1UAT9_HELPX|nr:hypothetical protein HPSA20_0317 [Helicobacter pylori SouthAfrica20]
MPFSKSLENFINPFKRIKNRSLVLALGFLILTFCLLLFLVFSDVSRLISSKDFFYVIQSHPKQTLIEDENYFYANKGLYKTNKEAFLRVYKIPENMPIERRENLSKGSKMNLALLFLFLACFLGSFGVCPND